MHFLKMHFSKMHFSKMHFSKILQIFGGLVLGCIKTKFCKKMCVRQHFSSSTRFASFCTAAISKFSQKKSVWKNSNVREISAKKLQMSQNLQNFVKFQKFQLDNLVDFEKCCRTHIYLQKSVPIQLKTSNILPKICQPTLSGITVSPAQRPERNEHASTSDRVHAPASLNELLTRIDLVDGIHRAKWNPWIENNLER